MKKWIAFFAVILMLVAAAYITLQTHILDSVFSAPTATSTSTPKPTRTPRPTATLTPPVALTAQATIVPISLASANITDLTAANIQTELTKSTGPTYIYICGSVRDVCALEDAVIAQVAQAYSGRVKFYHIDTDKSPELLSGLGITSTMQLPAHFLVKDPTDMTQNPITFTGYFSTTELSKIVDGVLAGRISAGTVTPPSATPGGTSGAPNSPGTVAPLGF